MRQRFRQLDHFVYPTGSAGDGCDAEGSETGACRNVQVLIQGVSVLSGDRMLYVSSNLVLC